MEVFYAGDDHVLASFGDIKRASTAWFIPHSSSTASSFGNFIFPTHHSSVHTFAPLKRKRFSRPPLGASLLTPEELEAKPLLVSGNKKVKLTPSLVTKTLSPTTTFKTLSCNKIAESPLSTQLQSPHLHRDPRCTANAALWMYQTPQKARTDELTNNVPMKSHLKSKNVSSNLCIGR